MEQAVERWTELETLKEEAEHTRPTTLAVRMSVIPLPVAPGFPLSRE